MRRINRLTWITPAFRMVFGLGLLMGFVRPGWGESQPVSAQAPAQEEFCAGEHQDVSLPLNDLGNAAYVRMDGQATDYTGGLYPSGLNLRPAEHEAAGVNLASQIGPLDVNGAPDDDAGKIGILSIGMSNTQQEFQAFMDLAAADNEINPRLVFVNGALGGQTAEKWVDPEARPWVEVEARLERFEISPLQIQVAWIKQTLTRGGAFPDQALALQADLEVIVQNLKSLFPNLKVAFLSSRTRSYTYERGLSPEPNAFETGFAVKWLIEKQINGHPGLNFDPAQGEVKAPYLTWGPYLWIDGENPRSDGQRWLAKDMTQDCTHPSTNGQKKVADMLMAFFKTDLLTTAWFLANEPIRLPTQTSLPTGTPTLIVTPVLSKSSPSPTPVPLTPSSTPAPTTSNRTTQPVEATALPILIIGSLLGATIGWWLWSRRKQV